MGVKYTWLSVLISTLPATLIILVFQIRPSNAKHFEKIPKIESDITTVTASLFH